MKHRTLFIIALSFVLPRHVLAKFPQEESVKKQNVPKIILESFQKAYPNARVKGYSKEIDGGKPMYEIESSEKGVNRDVTYSEDGTLISVEESLSPEKLPEIIKASLKKDFPRAHTRKCEQITKNGTVEYELVLQSGKELFEIAFNATGKLLRKGKK